MITLISLLWFFIGSYIGLAISDMIDQMDLDEGKIKGKYFTKRGRLERSFNFAVLMLNWPLILLVGGIAFGMFLIYIFIWEKVTGKDWIQEHPTGTSIFDDEDIDEDIDEDEEFNNWINNIEEERQIKGLCSKCGKRIYEDEEYHRDNSICEKLLCMECE